MHLNDGWKAADPASPGLQLNPETGLIKNTLKETDGRTFGFTATTTHDQSITVKQEIPLLP